jgi:hypothetical protein
MKMSCKKAEEYLVDYLYQELPAKKTLEIEKHLRTCAHCAKTLESWRAIHRAYQRNVEEPQIAPYFKQKIMAVAEEELSRSPSWTERFIFALKIATVPVAIFIIVLFLNEPKKQMASHSQEQKVAAPAAKPEAARDAQLQSADPIYGGRKLDSSAQEAKSREADYVDRLRAQLDEKRVDKDFAEKNKEEAAAGNDLSLGNSANEQPAAPPPAMSAPAEQVPPSDTRKEYEQVPEPQQKAARISAATKKTANEPFQKAQYDLQRNNLKGWQTNVQEAISLDDQRALASKLHQEGAIYQSRGEYGKAIPNYELVQSNYRD